MVTNKLLLSIFLCLSEQAIFHGHPSKSKGCSPEIHPRPEPKNSPGTCALSFILWEICLSSYHAYKRVTTHTPCMYRSTISVTLNWIFGPSVGLAEKLQSGDSYALLDRSSYFLNQIFNPDFFPSWSQFGRPNSTPTHILPATASFHSTVNFFTVVT